MHRVCECGARGERRRILIKDNVTQLRDEQRDMEQNKEQSKGRDRM